MKRSDQKPIGCYIGDLKQKTCWTIVPTKAVCCDIQATATMPLKQTLFDGREELQITYPIKFSLPRVFCKWQFNCFHINNFYLIRPNDGVFFEETLRWPFWFETKWPKLEPGWQRLITTSTGTPAHLSSMVTSGWLINKLILMLQFKKCVWRWKENRSCLRLYKGFTGKLDTPTKLKWCRKQNVKICTGNFSIYLSDPIEEGNQMLVKHLWEQLPIQIAGMSTFHKGWNHPICIILRFVHYANTTRTEIDNSCQLK